MLETPPQASILLVDDLPANLLALEALLAPFGHRLVRAASGHEALRCTLQEDFAVILMDVRLGDMSGIEVTAMLRDRERTRHTPVLLMTAASSDEGELLAGYAHGAVDYLRKPIVPEVLRTKVAVFVDLYLTREMVRLREEQLRLREREALESAHREHLHHLLMQAPAAIAILRGPDFVFEFANPLYEKVSGRQVVLGQRLRDVLPEITEQPAVMNLLRGVLETGRPFEGTEFPMRWDRHGQGELEEGFFNLMYQPVREPGGRVTGVLSFSVEVTEQVLARRRAEGLAEDLRRQKEALRISEERLRLAVSAASLGTWDFNPLTGELKWDTRCKELFGMPPEADSSYEAFLAGLHPEDRESTEQEVRRSFEPEGSGEFDKEYRTVGLRDGIERWVRAKGRAQFEQGQAVRFTGTVQDITGRKHAEQERTELLLRERHRAEQLKGLAEAAVAINGEGNLETVLSIVTKRARAIIGAHQAVALLSEGQDWARAVTSVSLSDKYSAWKGSLAVPEDTRLLTRVCEKNQPVRLTQAQLEAQGLGPRGDGQRPPRGWLAAPLTSRDGRNLGLILLSEKQEGEFTEEDESIVVQLAQMASVAVENVRLYVDLEQRVHERTLQLQEVNRELESFSYSVSHDLRAPLRHITGFAQLLERRAGAKLDESARGFLQTIITAAQQGGTLVDDLLSFARMGRAELHQKPVDLRALMEEVRRELESDAAGRSVEWRIGELPLVKADPALLRQVVRNLLSNALKYTRPKAQAVIEVGAREVNGEVEVWVRDNGVGFEMQYVDKLFGVFQRLHTVEQFEGTGIGLANVRRIISRHGGRTWAEGAVGQGATFHFSLPRAAPDVKEAHRRD